MKTLDKIRTELEYHLQIAQGLLDISKEHGDETGEYFYRGQYKAFDYALSLINSAKEKGGKNY